MANFRYGGGGGKSRGFIQFNDTDFGAVSNVTSAAGGGDSLYDAYKSTVEGSPDWMQYEADDVRNRANLEALHIGGEQSIREAEQNYRLAYKRANREGRNLRNDARRNAGKAGLGAIVQTALPLAIAALSDERTKNDIQTIDTALAKLRDLRPVTFYYNEEYSSSPERLHHGFIAQEYKNVMPDATYFDEELGKYCIDTSELIALLVRSIQELENRVTHMEAVQALVGVR